MNEEALTRLVAAAVRAVLKELRPTPPGGPLVRILIGDVDRLVDVALSSLGTLAGTHRLQAALTSEGSRQLTLDHARRLLGGQAEPAEAVGCPLAWAAEADALVVAALDRPTAVRAALTLPEGFAARWLLEGLRLGKPVVIAGDTLDVAAPAATPQLRAALAAPLATLESFGAEVCHAARLAETVDRLTDAARRNAGAESRVLVTEADVDAADGPLLVPDSAIVTPLAWDRAREKGVVIQRLPR